MGNSSPLKKIKQDYFNRINAAITNKATDNNNNPQNYSICLEKKDFHNSVVSISLSTRKDQKYVNWKKYLLYFLRKEAEQGVIWALNLHYWITNEEFFNEGMWLNDFFYQAYKLESQPKCMLKYEHDHYNNTYRLKDLSKLSTSAYNFKNNFMGSFLTTTFDSSTSHNALYDFKHNKNKIKQYVKYFQQHIFDNTHPINLIVKQFAKEFNETNEVLIRQIRSSELNQPEKRDGLNLIIAQLQKFIVEMQVVVKLYYSNTISYQYFMEEKDEFINLVTSLVFSNEVLYEKIYCLYLIVMRDEINTMRNQLKKFKDLQPEDLGIRKQFCLNESTKTFQESLILSLSEQHQNTKNNNSGNANGNKDKYPSDEDDELKMKMKLKTKEVINIQTKQNKPNQESTKYNNNNNNNNSNSSDSYQPKSLTINCLKDEELGNITTELNIISESQKVNVFKKPNKKQMPDRSNNKLFPPFQNAIQLLKSLANCKVPFEKMMIMATLSAEITDAVNIYWKDMENAINQPSLLSIDADQLMTIYIYIILKADIPELIIHSELVKQFTTSMTKSTMLGYYFTTLEGSLNYILEIKDKKDFLRSGMIEEEEGH